MTRKRLGKTASVLVSLRIPEEWSLAYDELSSKERPPRELMRDALREYLDRRSDIERVKEPLPAIIKTAADIPPIPKRRETPAAVPGKTCIHGIERGYNCWQCGGLATI